MAVGLTVNTSGGSTPGYEAFLNPDRRWYNNYRCETCFSFKVFFALTAVYTQTHRSQCLDPSFVGSFLGLVKERISFLFFQLNHVRDEWL